MLPQEAALQTGSPSTSQAGTPGSNRGLQKVAAMWTLVLSRQVLLQVLEILSQIAGVLVDCLTHACKHSSQVRVHDYFKQPPRTSVQRTCTTDTSHSINCTFCAVKDTVSSSRWLEVGLGQKHTSKRCSDEAHPELEVVWTRKRRKRC